MKHAAMGAAKKIQVTSEDVSEDFLDELIWIIGYLGQV